MGVRGGETLKGEGAKGRGTGPGERAPQTDSASLRCTKSKATSSQNKIDIQFKAIISFIQKINISLLSRQISNHIKHREEIQSLWKL